MDGKDKIPLAFARQMFTYVWSRHHFKRLKYTLDEAEEDEVAVEGDVAEEGSEFFHLEIGQAVVAVQFLVRDYFKNLFYERCKKLTHSIDRYGEMLEKICTERHDFRRGDIYKLFFEFFAIIAEFFLYADARTAVHLRLGGAPVVWVSVFNALIRPRFEKIGGWGYLIEEARRRYGYVYSHLEPLLARMRAPYATLPVPILLGPLFAETFDDLRATYGQMLKVLMRMQNSDLAANVPTAVSSLSRAPEIDEISRPQMTSRRLGQAMREDEEAEREISAMQRVPLSTTLRRTTVVTTSQTKTTATVTATCQSREISSGAARKNPPKPSPLERNLQRAHWKNRKAEVRERHKLTRMNNPPADEETTSISTTGSSDIQSPAPQSGCTPFFGGARPKVKSYASSGTQNSPSGSDNSGTQSPAMDSGCAPFCGVTRSKVKSPLLNSESSGIEIQSPSISDNSEMQSPAMDSGCTPFFGTRSKVKSPSTSRTPGPSASENNEMQSSPVLKSGCTPFFGGNRSKAMAPPPTPENSEPRSKSRSVSDSSELQSPAMDSGSCSFFGARPKVKSPAVSDSSGPKPESSESSRTRINSPISSGGSESPAFQSGCTPSSDGTKVKLLTPPPDGSGPVFKSPPGSSVKKNKSPLTAEASKGPSVRKIAQMLDYLEEKVFSNLREAESSFEQTAPSEKAEKQKGKDKSSSSDLNLISQNIDRAVCMGIARRLLSPEPFNVTSRTSSSQTARISDNRKFIPPPSSTEASIEFISTLDVQATAGVRNKNAKNPDETGKSKLSPSDKMSAKTANKDKKSDKLGALEVLAATETRKRTLPPPDTTENRPQKSDSASKSSKVVDRKKNTIDKLGHLELLAAAEVKKITMEATKIATKECKVRTSGSKPSSMSRSSTISEKGATVITVPPTFDKMRRDDSKVSDSKNANTEQSPKISSPIRSFQAFAAAAAELNKISQRFVEIKLEHNISSLPTTESQSVETKEEFGHQPLGTLGAAGTKSRETEDAKLNPDDESPTKSDSITKCEELSKCSEGLPTYSEVIAAEAKMKVSCSSSPVKMPRTDPPRFIARTESRVQSRDLGKSPTNVTDPSTLGKDSKLAPIEEAIGESSPSLGRQSQTRRKGKKKSSKKKK